MMAGIGMATIFAHCVGGALSLGLNLGFAAMASRAFGAKNKDKYKQYFRQGLTNLGFMLMFFILVATCSYRLIKLTGQS